MSSKKIDRSNWFEALGYGLAIVIGVGWGLGLNAGFFNSTKTQEPKAPSVINSDY
jgi:hypothetical protein